MAQMAQSSHEDSQRIKMNCLPNQYNFAFKFCDKFFK